MCGADSGSPTASGRLLGSPPRVRSRRQVVLLLVGGLGITSACAEQTETWNYAPPSPRLGPGPRRGITSACAEQTTAPSTRPSWTRDHLRVCGADLVFACPMASDWGSPPRVRSRLTGTMILFPSGRITSACAEQTKWTCSRPCVTRDHLRVCGADVVGCVSEACGRGSPPRVRSRQHGGNRRRIERGITSACAEQTRAAPTSAATSRDHLRVCGADHRLLRTVWAEVGSPPRVRSRLHLRVDFRHISGITSACAEQTT